MDNTNLVIIKMITGETIIGGLTKKTKSSVTIDQPLVYQFVTVSTPAGQTVKQFVSFRPWCELSTDTEITFKINQTVGPSLTPNMDLTKFYEAELANRQLAKNKQIEKQEEQPDQEKSTPNDKLRGMLNFNMEFQNPEDLQMFMESVQFGLDNLIEGMDPDEILEDAQEELESFFESNNIPHKKPNKKAKKKKTSKESFDLPYNKNGDPKDPSSWSDNPNDYLN